jgi:hypothetical protein
MMKESDRLLRKFQDLEAVRRVLIERGEVRVQSEDERAQSDATHAEAMRRLLERKSAERKSY